MLNKSINDFECYHKKACERSPGMSFCLRLRLLLWKNWILRKRNKWRSIFEFLWPLSMILFVVLLHKIGDKYPTPNCHFKPKAMPSAGGVVFMQSFFCSVNNTCDAELNATCPCFNASLVSDLGNALREAFNLSLPIPNTHIERKSSKIEKTLKNWAKDILIVESIIEAVKKNDKEKWKSLNESLVFYNETKFICHDIFNNPFLVDNKTVRKKSSNEFLADSNYITTHNEAQANDLMILSRIKRKIYLVGLIDSLYQLLKNKSSENTGVNSLYYELKIIDFLLCGPNVPQLMAQITSLIESGRKKSRKSEETMDPAGSTYVVDVPEWENDTTNFCNHLMRNLESTYPTRVLFRLFKPLVRGKIIYTPDAPVTRRIMSRINETLYQVKLVIDLIEKEIENSSADKDRLKFEKIINDLKNNETLIREIVESDIGKRIFESFSEGTMGSGDTKSKIKLFMNYLDETSATWKKLHQITKNESNFAKLLPYLECVDINRTIPVRDEANAVKEALYWLNRERLWGLIVFQNLSSDSNALPPSLTYKIRTGLERTPDTHRLQDRIYVPRVRRNIIYDLREITGGLAYLQNMIEGELLREYTGRKHLPGIYLKQTPFPCHIYDTFRDAITRTFPMFMVISWIFIFCMVTKRIVAEKEVLFKGTLKVFGVSNSQHWISWFVDSFVPMIVITTAMSVLLVEGGLIPNSSIFVIWMFLTAFTLPTITLSFLVSTFFCKSSLAMAVSGMIYFLLYLPYPPIQNFGEALNPDFKIFCCLLSNVGFGLGCTWIANMEEIGIGAQLSKINYSPVPGNPITLSLIIEMFLIDSIIYLLLAIYFDNVFEASDFVKLPWYYCLMPSYWKRNWVDDNKGFQSCCQEEKDPRYFEMEPEGFHVGIEVVNLSKDFGKGKEKRRVVKNLTINFYEDQITSFLGQNGAGKTITVSMMIGLLPITEGTVRIHGIDIKNHIRMADRDIGICRQENVLLDDLTVEEHIKLFARLKNRPEPEVENDMREIISDLQLGHRAKQPVKILSGGMKRKVCVAMAFIGGCRTVFLDEPTAGIDPYARRSIWELLVKYKKGRTIILTTHFLDEADILGDRIAIIASGELQCCGSSLFLKSNFGKGYYLTIESNIRSVKMSENFREESENTIFSAQVEELNSFIKNIVPTAEFSEQVGSEIVFVIPSQVSPDRYNDLFTELNANKDRLNIASFGVNDTSLEEVFVKILVEAEMKNGNGDEKLKQSLGDEKNNIFKKKERSELGNATRVSFTRRNSPEKTPKMTRKRMIVEHFIALSIKRLLHHKRNFKILLIEVLLPTFFMAISLALAKALPKVSEMPPLVVDMSTFGPSSIFYTNEFPDNRYTFAYEESLLSPYGLGTKCVLEPEKCSLVNISRGSLIVRNETTEDSKNCSCPKGYFECYNETKLSKPPNALMSEGFTLFNLTGLNLTNWLLTTEFEDSDHRFGGISLGHFEPLTGIAIRELLHLFTFEKFIKILDNIVINGDSSISPETLTFLIMSMACNKTYGDELYKDRDLTDNVVIWFNNRAWMASLAMMNGVTNMILRASLADNSDSSKYSIRLINHPLPITKRQLEDQIELQTNIALVCALSVIWALSFIPAMYAVYLVEENVSGLKNLEMVSGMNRVMYWLTNLIWDLVSYSISISAIVFLYFLFHMTAFVSKDTIATFIVLLYSYGFVNIAFVYVISFGFSVPSTAFVFVACWNILSGVATLLSTFTLVLISNKENPYYLNTIFIVFPQFCFGKCLVNMALEGIRHASMENFGVKTFSSGFDWNLITKYVVVMLINGVMLFGITLLIEYEVFQKFIADEFVKRFWKNKKILSNDDWRKNEDDDVRRERERVESGKARADGDVLIINNLTKVYSRREAAAVDHICVGIKRGECYGLLGLNGAGKTTVFKMLTGCTAPSQGDATIGGFSIRTDPLKAELLIGYCPQINALDPYLTAEEHLSFFCRIRGVTGQRKEREVSWNIERVGLSKQRGKIVKKLSGGNKRKVNTAIALVCNPELVLLDEPTSGMDVLSRRLLWHCLQDVMLEGCCVVLTSHSMEECQALCTHLSIMVNGRFSCFGSCQHLKNKFNEGYSVLIRLFSLDTLQNVVHFMEKNFPECSLLHVHNKQLKYTMSPNIFIGTIFTVMNKAKEENLIQDYSITQTTLENIFLKLAGTAEPAKVPESKFKYLRKICCRKH